MRLAILTLAVCSLPILAQTPPKTVEETKALLTSHPWYVSGNCTVDQSDWDTFTNASSGANDGLFDQRSGRGALAGALRALKSEHPRMAVACAKVLSAPGEKALGDGRHEQKGTSPRDPSWITDCP